MKYYPPLSDSVYQDDRSSKNNNTYAFFTNKKVARYICSRLYKLEKNINATGRFEIKF